MNHSLSEDLQREMSSEEVLSCFYGLRELELECYRVLLRTREKRTIDEIAERVNRDRSTTYRAVRRLFDVGLVRKEQINYDDGGYYHVYYAIDPREITHEMRTMLSERYARMERLIHRFESTGLMTA